MTNIESFHISYNARHLKPEDVAQTFISNSDYKELVQDNHTVLLGARGCGKTTLMKMLTLPALYSWKDELAEEFRQKISFYAVYISTDIYWNAQKDSYNEQLKSMPKYALAVSKVAVTTNVLYALCETFENILKYKIENNDISQEIELSKTLIEGWSLPPTIPNIAMVKESLLRRADLLNRHIQKTIFNCVDDSEVKLENDFFFIDYDPVIINAISAFERIYKITNNPRWALCFDELELAPIWLQDRLFNSLRSRTQKILYKLSASPILSISDNISASPNNDLKLVKMWPHGKRDKYQEFSEAILKSLLFKKFNRDIEPELIFGSNPLFRKDHEKKDYEEGGETWKQIIDLAKDDPDLRKLLQGHHINPKNPQVGVENRRKLDTVLRKIKPIVYFRNYYSTYDIKSKNRKARSRKASTLFYGKEVIYRICDGNPRWLIGIVEAILTKCNNNRIQKISDASQAMVLKNIADQFYNVIKTIPGAVFQTKHKMYTLSGILKEVGDTFFNEIVIDKFQRDPHSTFTIDKGLNPSIIKILEKGAYQGAIILIDPAENSFDFEMRGKRFRLSYLLSPLFKIPLRKYAAIPLSKCLTGKEIIMSPQKTVTGTRKSVLTNQTELPFNFKK
ncbi:MAG: hypothetical protein HY064_09745 [Bacteroidetes bacterium]|nr:hypothetical protein [Bacteroidota bacterium]